MAALNQTGEIEPRIPGSEIMPDSTTETQIGSGESQESGESGSEAQFENPAEEKNLSEKTEALRKELEAIPEIEAVEIKEITPEKSIEEKKEIIIERFMKAVRAARDNEDKLEKIVKMSRKYIEKGYPEIADAVHDRILEERNRGMHQDNRF